MNDRTCSIESCERPACKRGWCGAHYYRWRRYGSPTGGGPERLTGIDGCSIEGCAEKHKCRGLCRLHYDRWLRRGDPGEADKLRQSRPPECSVEGCDRPCRARGWCATHWSRWSRTGDPGLAEKIRNPLPPECLIDGCTGVPHGRGMCSKHYDRWLKYGDAAHLEGVARGGDEIGYGAVHYRLRRQRGRASEHGCEHCGGQAAEWAYTHDASDERRDELTGMPYSIDIQSYMPLCVSCHQKFDWNQRQVA